MLPWFTKYPNQNDEILNLDWLLKEFDKMVAEWTKVKQDWTTEQEAFNSLKQFVTEYFDNLDVQDEINNIIEEMYNDGRLQALFKRAPLELTQNMFKNYWYNARNGGVQGGCYVGDNRFVFYETIDGTNTGTLRCLDVDTNLFLWNHVLELYHANSICYDPVNRKLYACAAFDYSDWNTLIPYVLKIDIDSPDHVEEIITAPVDLYSICYDFEHQTFYGVQRNPSTIFKFQGEFESYETITLDGALRLSNQGVQCVVDNVIYIPYYDPAIIMGFDLDTGKCVYKHNVKQVVNQYRYLKEFEALTYDFDNNRFVGIFITYGSMNPTYAGVASFVELGLYKPVIEQKYISEYTINYPDNDIYVETDLGSLTPSYEVADTKLGSLQDAFTLVKSLNLNYATIHLKGNATNVVIDSFNGLIRAYDLNNHSKFTSFINVGCDVTLRAIDVEGFNNNYGVDAGIKCLFNGLTKLMACTLSVNVNTYGVWSSFGGVVKVLQNCTFSGSGVFFKIDSCGEIKFASTYNESNYGYGSIAANKFELSKPYFTNYHAAIFNGYIVNDGTEYDLALPVQFNGEGYYFLYNNRFNYCVANFSSKVKSQYIFTTVESGIPAIHFGEFEINTSTNKVKLNYAKYIRLDTMATSDETQIAVIFTI